MPLSCRTVIPLLFLFLALLGWTGPAGAEEATRLTAKLAPAAPRAGEWGGYLDRAHELISWERSEIAEWREAQEKQLGRTLADYMAEWERKLLSFSGSPAVREDIRQPVYRESDYLRLAAAEVIDYLLTGKSERVTTAGQLLGMLNQKKGMPLVAFWSGYVAALQAIENDDSDAFIASAFSLWNQAVLYMEQGRYWGKGDSEASFLYRSMVMLIVERAIISRKMENLDALGPLFLMLRERDLGEEESDGRYLTTLVERITEGFTAPDADRFKLNYTVAMIEARKQQKKAAALLDSEGMTEQARRAFESSRLFDDYALKWARFRRSSGAVAAVTDYLDTTSLAIQRLEGNESAPARGYFAMLPTHDGSSTLMKAMAIYNDMAASAGGDWAKAGYATRADYLAATHRLWRAIMELALWTGDHYLQQVSAAKDQRKIFSLVAPMQGALTSYLEFLFSQESRGVPEIIPASAYFGAAEAAEKLAWAYARASSYSTDGKAYDLWVKNRLQAARIFPLDPRGLRETGSTLRRDGRYDQFLDRFLPLVDRFRRSEAVRKWLSEETSEYVPIVRKYVDGIDRIVTPADDEGDGEIGSVIAGLGKLREELQRKPDHPAHRLLKAFYQEETRPAPAVTPGTEDGEK